MSGRTKVLLVCAVSVGASIFRLSAQEVGGDTITGKVHQIEKVTVTARRLPNKVASAVPIQTISRQDISQLGIQNMADAVRRFAGANVKDYGGIGGLKTVSIRNMGAAHTAVSYDGVAVSNCQAGQIDIGRFSLDNVSMLSLAIGQSEDLLQSARLYASAGVLGIETEKPHFDDGRNAAFQARVRGGSFGMVSPSLRWWQKLGSRTRVALDASYMRADGNYPFTLVNGKYVTEEKRNNSGIYSWQGEATLYHTFKDDSEQDVKGYYFFTYNIKTGQMNNASFLKDAPAELTSSTLYMLEVNENNGDIYISTSEFTTNGTIYRFKKDGTFIEKFDAGGINPNSAVFFN